MSTKKLNKKVTKVAKVKAPRPLLTLPLKPKKPKVKEKTITLSDVDAYLGEGRDYDIHDELSMELVEFMGGKVRRYVNSWGEREWEEVDDVLPEYRINNYSWLTSKRLQKIAEFITLKEASLPGIEGTKKLLVYLDGEHFEWRYDAKMYPTPEEIHAQNKRFDAAMERYEKALEVYNHPVSVEARHKRDEKESKLIQAKVDKLKKAQAELEKKLKKAS